MNQPPVSDSVQACVVPLVVDLDGTLLRSDLLIETIYALLARSPGAIAGLAPALLAGKARFKHYIADTVAIDPALLPYDDAVLEEIRSAHAAGTPVYLVSASHETYVERIARHLGLFDGYAGTTATLNLSGPHKAAYLISRFGEGGFDYIGNSADDLPVWASARARIAVRTRLPVTRKLRRIDPEARFLPHQGATLKTWMRMLRVHQWAKNGLVFVPLLTSHKFTLTSLFATMQAFVAFCLCASAVYIFNDQADLAADRAHRSKRYRPLAAGLLPLHHATLVGLLLAVGAFTLAATMSNIFLLLLGCYLALTTSYTFVFKRKMVIDVIILALLYTVRVVGGAIAISVFVSEWLLAFSIFFFLYLALIKRYADLLELTKVNKTKLINRNYEAGDVNIVAALAAASGFNSITVLALWVSSSEVHLVYSRPQLLWLIFPPMLYWIARALIMASRRLMNDDPVIYALKDRNSLFALAIVAAIVLAAI